jgi:hypothetical protein
MKKTNAVIYDKDDFLRLVREEVQHARGLSDDISVAFISSDRILVEFPHRLVKERVARAKNSDVLPQVKLPCREVALEFIAKTQSPFTSKDIRAFAKERFPGASPSQFNGLNIILNLMVRRGELQRDGQSFTKERAI